MTVPTATSREAVLRAARCSVTLCVVVGVGLALLPGPASGNPATAPVQAVPAGPSAPAATTLARTDEGLRVTSLAVPLADATARSAGTAAELAPTRVQPFGLVGVTWQADTAPADLGVQVRLHQPDGWTGWRTLPYEASEGPAPDEEPDARPGTGPLWTGGADGIAARVTSSTGAGPSDVQVVTVDPGADPAGTARGPAMARPGSGDAIRKPPRFPEMPRVISRRKWGANPNLTDSCDSPRYGRTAKMVFVHHTVNSNGYSRRESPAIVRAILAYHTQGQNWCDIGYNALIDRFGNVYEGRRGGLRKPVRGAHAGDYNTGTVGVSMMGNFDVRRPSARMKNALVRFIGWRLGTSYKPVRGVVGVNGHRFARISGHRDAMATACPGRFMYAQLPRIRQRVAAYLSRYHSKLERKADHMGVHRTGQVWKGERRVNGGFRTVFHRGWMFGKHGLGAHMLAGRVLKRYLATGGPKGLIGWPKTGMRKTPTKGFRVLVGQHGRMYMHRHATRKVIHGPIYRRYKALGFASSRLGFPRTNVFRTGRGTRTDFQDGTITWNRNLRKTRVFYS